MGVCVCEHVEGQVPLSSLASTTTILVRTDAIQIFSDYKWQHENKNQEETPPTRFPLFGLAVLKISKCAFRSLHMCVCVFLISMYVCVYLLILVQPRNVCTHRVTHTPACGTVSLQLHTRVHVCACVHTYIHVYVVCV